MAVDPAAFVKWCYQQVLFSQPPWQSYRLFSSTADPCLLLTVLATDQPPQFSRDSYSFSLSFSFCFLPSFALLFFFFNYMQPAATKASRDGVWSWVLMGAWESTPTDTPSSKFKATLTHTHRQCVCQNTCSTLFKSGNQHLRFSLFNIYL